MPSEHPHDRKCRLALMTWGLGGETVGKLLESSASRANLVESIALNSLQALESRLGGALDQAVSDATARALAVSAFFRVRALAEANHPTIAGIGVTAQIVSSEEERGPSEVHVAWQALDRTVALSYISDRADRCWSQRERLAQEMLLGAVDEASGSQAPVQVRPGDVTVQRREAVAPLPWRELLLGERTHVAVDGNQSSPRVLFPGAFNPLHAGHKRMAALAEEKLGSPVTLELSITNVDKPPLDYLAIQQRLATLAGRSVMLTRSATFAEKADLFPGCTFVVGIDTIERIGQVRFYDHHPERRDQAIRYLAERGCRFLVFGRADGVRFRGLRDADLPAALRALCTEVPLGEFRHDVSSSGIRASRWGETPLP